MGAVESGLLELDATSVAALHQAGEVVLVDVRESHEWCAEHVPGAVRLPMSRFDAAAWPFTGRKVVLMCRAGMRSAMVGRRLLAEGHRAVVNFAGGMEAWKSAGLPIEEGD